MWTLHRRVRRTLSFNNRRPASSNNGEEDGGQRSTASNLSLSDAGQVILRSLQQSRHRELQPSFSGSLVQLDGRVYTRQPLKNKTEMVSRRRILSRSRDDLSQPDTAPAITQVLDEEDVWYSKDKLVKDHLSEVLTKWSQIDDEIWSKVIIFERNRRVAKAYARAPVLTINGSGEGFDGFRIGLNGFSNPMRDQKTEDILKHVGHGCKLKMDDEGNVLVKRISRNGVWVRCLGEEEQGFGLEVDKAVKLFDMRAFTSKISRELRRAYPDRRKLETECIMSISFVKQDENLLSTPCWIMIINLVAMDMLKAKLPPIKGREPVRERETPPWQQPSIKTDIRNRPKIPIPGEDEGPPKLPPRDVGIPKPDYDDSSAAPGPGREEGPKTRSNNGGGFFSRKSKDSKEKKREQPPPSTGGVDRKYDDPYYCGLRARIPAFVQRAGGQPPAQQYPRGNKQPIVEPIYVSSSGQMAYGGYGVAPSRYGRQPVAVPAPWQPAKSMDGSASLHSNPYADPLSLQQQQQLRSGKYGWGPAAAFDTDSCCEDRASELYAPIYGRLPLPMRNPNTFAGPDQRRQREQQQAYVGDWE